jgi:hypothetical protein
VLFLAIRCDTIRRNSADLVWARRQRPAARSFASQMLNFDRVTRLSCVNNIRATTFGRVSGGYLRIWGPRALIVQPDADRITFRRYLSASRRRWPFNCRPPVGGVSRSPSRYIRVVSQNEWRNAFINKQTPHVGRIDFPLEL